MEQPITSRLRRPGYADIEALPPNVVGEILAGELVVSPRPAGPHAVAASCIGGYLNHAFELGLSGPGGWWIVDEPELSLGVDPDFDPVVPDLAGWRLETHPERPMSAQMHATPDWVCEVQSPGTARVDQDPRQEPKGDAPQGRPEGGRRMRPSTHASSGPSNSSERGEPGPSGGLDLPVLTWRLRRRSVPTPALDSSRHGLFFAWRSWVTATVVSHVPQNSGPHCVITTPCAAPPPTSHRVTPMSNPAPRVP